MKHSFENSLNSTDPDRYSALSSEVQEFNVHQRFRDDPIPPSTFNHLPKLEISDGSNDSMRDQPQPPIKTLLADPATFKSILNEHGYIDRALLATKVASGTLPASTFEAAKDLLTQFDANSTDGHSLNPDLLARSSGIELSCTDTSRLNLSEALQSDPELFGKLVKNCKIDLGKLSAVLSAAENSPHDSFWTAERENILEQLRVSFAVLSNDKESIDLGKLDVNLKLPADKDPTTSDYFFLRGLPSISAEKIDEVLASYKSPMTGEGQQIFDIAFEHGIDPAVALAFFQHESTCGTMGVARKTKGWGNFRDGRGGFLHYQSWQDGFVDWCDRMQRTYLADREQGGFGTQSLDKIVPIYAPSSDGNAPDTYIRKAKRMITEWRGDA